jgi:hypothetical protein
MAEYRLEWYARDLPLHRKWKRESAKRRYWQNPEMARTKAIAKYQKDAGSIKLQHRLRREANPELARAQDRRQRQARKQKDLEHRREKYKTKQGRQTILARNAVYRAIKCGKIKQLPCTVCGHLLVHAHHEDYSRPLEVTWLCQKHHTTIHHPHIAA